MKKEIIKNALLLLCGFSCCTCLESFGMEGKNHIVVDQSISKYEKIFNELKKTEFSKEQHINNNLNVARLLESQIPFLISNFVRTDDTGFVDADHITPYQGLISRWINEAPDLLAIPDFQNFQREYNDKADLLQLAFFIKSKANIQSSEFSDDIDTEHLLALARVALAIGRSIAYVQSLEGHFDLTPIETCALRAYRLNMKNILWMSPKDEFDQQAIIWNAGRIVFDFFGFTESEFISTLPDTDEAKADVKAAILKKIKDSEKRMFSEEDTKYKEKTTEDPTILLLHHMIDNVHIWFKDEKWTKEDFKAYSSYKNGTKKKTANSAILIPQDMLPLANWFSETLNTLSSESQNVRTYLRENHEEMCLLIPFSARCVYTQPGRQDVYNKFSNHVLLSINRDGVLKTMYPHK